MYDPVSIKCREAFLGYQISLTKVPLSPNSQCKSLSVKVISILNWQDSLYTWGTYKWLLLNQIIANTSVSTNMYMKLVYISKNAYMHEGFVHWSWHQAATAFFALPGHYITFIYIYWRYFLTSINIHCNFTALLWFGKSQLLIQSCQCQYLGKWFMIWLNYKNIKKLSCTFSKSSLKDCIFV
jgi:hypothetical protein